MMIFRCFYAILTTQRFLETNESRRYNLLAMLEDWWSLINNYLQNQNRYDHVIFVKLVTSVDGLGNRSLSSMNMLFLTWSGWLCLTSFWLSGWPIDRLLSALCDGVALPPWSSCHSHIDTASVLIYFKPWNTLLYRERNWGVKTFPCCELCWLRIKFSSQCPKPT